MQNVFLFKTLILEYNNTVWNPDSKRDSIKLESVQRRATKMLPCLKDLTNPDCLKLIFANVNVPSTKRRLYSSVQGFT